MMKNKKVIQLFDEKFNAIGLTSSVLLDAHNRENSYKYLCDKFKHRLEKKHARTILEIADNFFEQGFRDEELSERILTAIKLLAELIVAERELEPGFHPRVEHELLKSFEVYAKETERPEWSVEWDAHANVVETGCHAKIVYRDMPCW